jgi:RhtB (resistance to homoserine/threonine) family protein
VEAPSLDPQIIAFFFVAGVLTITPGSDTLLVIKNALRGGSRDGFGTTAGICSGLFVHALASALGISVILAKSAAAFHAVKLVGALYLVWLGIQTFRHRDSDNGAVRALPKVASRMQSFREGFITNVLNPKVAVFYLAFLPQFISRGDHVLAKSVLLATIHLGQGIIWLGGISIAVGKSRAWVSHPRIRAWLSRISGTVLVALGMRLALQER